MDVLIPPTFKFFHLLPYLIYAMLLFHLPYMGTVLVSALFSVAYGKHKPGLSKDFINLILGKAGVWLAFGLVPPLALAVLYKMLLFNTSVPIHKGMLFSAADLLVGLALLAFYRRKGHLIAGAAGVLALMIYLFRFISLTTFLMFPEKWPIHTDVFPFPLYAITPLFHFAAFLFMSLILTGAAVLFFYYRWSERKIPEDHPNYNLLKYHAYGLLLAGSLLMPLILLLDLATLPNYALSFNVFFLAGLIILVLSLLISTSVAQLRDYSVQKPRFSILAFILALLLFGLMIGKDYTLLANANLETNTAMSMDSEKIMKNELAVREEIYAKNMVIDIAVGEQIFTQQCTACHSFEKKVLGPAFNDVLPKYTADPAKLEAFLKNPAKIDPAFPPMPNPGLGVIQIKSVVKFLMSKMGKDMDETKDETKEPGNQNHAE